MAFLSSGHILHRYGSSAVASVRGLAADAPGLAAMFALAIAALLGFPPAALFASELGIARAGADARLGWAVALVFALALLAFAAITAGTGRMLLGPPATTTRRRHPSDGSPPSVRHAVPGRARVSLHGRGRRGVHSGRRRRRGSGAPGTTLTRAHRRAEPATVTSGRRRHCPPRR